jgi:N-sulfoglucosamine sulfohydrolase
LGDHGAQFPRGKLSSYESGLRVPLIIRFPNNVATTNVRSELVSTLDLAPTILEAAGVAIPEELPGRSLLGLLRGELQSPRRYLFTEYHGHYPPLYFPQRTVRDARYKLIVNLLQDRPNPVAEVCSRLEHPSQPTYVAADEVAAAANAIQSAYQTWYDAPLLELYDLQSDPHEWRNLADDQALSDVKQRLLSELHHWQQRTADPLADPDKLRRLTAEHDAIATPYVRPAAFEWQYPKFLAPPPRVGDE